ncbi:MAG: nucleotidyltransferase domain-containing protein [Ktedonobacterales bacterium]
MGRKGHLMRADDVLSVMECLHRAGVRVYIGGGWGVDALLGEQTRQHADLDLSFNAQDEDCAIHCLQVTGFAIVEDQRPTRFVMRDMADRSIDLHPVTFDATGAGIQIGFDRLFHYPVDGFAFGMIAGTRVPCLRAEQQVCFHSDYQPSEKDRRDMFRLRERFGVELPDTY